MKKQVIRITEIDFYNIIKESVINILAEISIKDKYNKEINIGKTKMDYNTYEFLCKIDPSTTDNKVGKLANWILAKYNPNTDFNELKRCIEWYCVNNKKDILNRLNVSNDINTFNTYDEFITTINGITQNNNEIQISNSEYNNRQKLEGQFEILGSTSYYDIIAPLTYEAERYFGSHTSWCTVANEYDFEVYFNEGELVIIYPKDGNPDMKMQFHFISDSYAIRDNTSYESPYDCIRRVISDEKQIRELTSLCCELFPVYEGEFFTFDERLPKVMEKLKNGEDVYDCFDYTYDYGWFYKVDLNDKNNIYIKNRKELLCDKWYDGIGYCDEKYNYALVNLDKKYNIISLKDGKLISKQWFNDITYANESDSVKLSLNNKSYIFNFKKGIFL